MGLAASTGRRVTPLDSTGMRKLRQVAALSLSALLLVACGDGEGADGDQEAGGCQDAVARAAESTNLEDDVNLEPVFEACRDLAELGAAVQDSPEILRSVGADVRAWAQKQCRDSETLRDTRLCEALG